MDISSMIYRSEDVLDIEEYKEGFSTILIPADRRATRSPTSGEETLMACLFLINRDYTRKHIPPDSLASTLNLVNRYNYREQQLTLTTQKSSSRSKCQTTSQQMSMSWAASPTGKCFPNTS